MFMRYVTRTAAVIVVVSSLGAFGSSFAQSAASPAPPSATTPPAAAAATPAPRSIMLQPQAASDTASREAGNDPDEANVQQLEGVTVQGQRDAFSKSDQHMKDLINGLPCTGCDTKGKKINEHRSFGERAAKFVATQCCIPSAPPVETEANELDRELTQQVINPTNNHP